MSSRPEAQKPPASVREAGTEWARLWYSTLDALIAQDTWRPEQRGDLEAYVNACRLGRFHREQAEEAPYTLHAESGRVFAHPGFALARDAQREQRALAETLILTPTARKVHDVREPSPFDDLDALVARRALRRSGAGSHPPGPPSPDLPGDIDGAW